MDVCSRDNRCSRCIVYLWKVKMQQINLLKLFKKLWGHLLFHKWLIVALWQFNSSLPFLDKYKEKFVILLPNQWQCSNQPNHVSISQTSPAGKSQNVSTPPTITHGCSTHFRFFKPSPHNGHVQNVPFGTSLSPGSPSPSSTTWKASRRFWQVPAPANHSFSYNHLPLPFLHKAGRESHPSAHYCLLILGPIIRL